MRCDIRTAGSRRISITFCRRGDTGGQLQCGLQPSLTLVYSTSVKLVYWYRYATPHFVRRADASFPQPFWSRLHRSTNTPPRPGPCKAWPSIVQVKPDGVASVPIEASVGLENHGIQSSSTFSGLGCFGRVQGKHVCTTAS